MTVEQGRERIVRHLRGKGWTPIGELAAWMKSELRISMQTGDKDLRTLVLAGQRDRRATAPAGSFFKGYEYRVVPTRGRGRRAARVSP